MAKCLKNNYSGIIQRFSEKTRNEQFKIIDMVNSGTWSYVSKKEWKSSRPLPEEKSKKKKNKFK